MEDSDVSSVTNMKEMFSNCLSMINITVEKWDVSNVTDMASMFERCMSLRSIDADKWDISKVLDMSKIFDECYSLGNYSIHKREQVKKKYDYTIIYRFGDKELKKVSGSACYEMKISA